MKPIETGCKNVDGKLIPEDALRLANIINLEEKLDLLCPYRFETPVAPYVASKIENKTIKLEEIKKAFELLSEPLFVEGAGGLMVPIFKDFFMIDLIKYLSLEVIFVAPLRLGTINQTMLSIEALERRKIPIKGIILNDTEGIKTPATETNFAILRELQPYPVLTIVPFNGDENSTDFSSLFC